jgi:hypothetical protein
MILVVIGALAIAAAGCGESESSEQSLTKKEFVKQADAICAKNDKKFSADLAAATKGSGPSSSRKELVQIAETVLFPNVEAELEALRQLPAPEGDAKQVAKILEAVEAGLKQAEGEAKGDLKAVVNPFEKAEQLAGEYGLEVCAW